MSTLPLSRRTFLSTSTAAAAAFAAYPTAVRAKNFAPSDQVTVGVMGLQRGMSLCNTFADCPGVRLKYVCEVDSQRLNLALKSLERLAPSPQGVGDFRTILDDPEVDALVVAAPNHWHAPASILACAAGKHVYVEKPCSHNPREGELLVEAARKHNRAVQMGSQRRSAPGFRTAMELLHSGTIGRVYLARSYYNTNRTSIGVGKPAEPPTDLNYDLWQGPAPRVPMSTTAFPTTGTGSGTGGTANSATTAPTVSTSAAGVWASIIRFASRPPADATTSRTTSRRPTRIPSASSSTVAGWRPGKVSAATGTTPRSRSSPLRRNPAL
ncbi:MAG: Gfo/Idh/MocA family oxidoreductase [Planctomycetaceae bacterium]